MGNSLGASGRLPLATGEPVAGYPDRMPPRSHPLPQDALFDPHTIRVLDLFAGAGGLSEGLRTGDPRFQTVCAVEMEPRAAATYAENHPEAHVYAGTIQDWLQNEAVPPVDVVVGGPPCQGFSALGKQDANDERNSMWRHYADAVARARPKFFVMENVPQFLTSPEFELLSEMVQPGSPLEDYDFTATVLNAADYGAPQLRRRAIVIGFLRSEGAPGLPEKTHGEAAPYVTVRDAIAVLPPVRPLPAGRERKQGGKSFAGPFRADELHVTRNYSDLSLKRFAEIPEGGNRFNLPDELKCKAWLGHDTGSGDVMGRLHWDKPSVTIRTEFTKPEKGRYLHPKESRAITPYEGALLQGFPADYRFIGSVTEIVKQIGNAVPIPLGAALGRVLGARIA